MKSEPKTSGRGDTHQKTSMSPSDNIDTVIGQIVVSKDEHLRCLNCIRYRASRQKPGAGYCTRTLFDDKGTFLGRANEDVLESYWCNQFRSRLGEQQQ